MPISHRFEYQLTSDRKPSLAFVMPYDEGRPGRIPLFWNMGLAWPHNAERLGYKIHFIWARKQIAPAVVEELVAIQNKVDAIFFLCGDQHLAFLFDSPELLTKLSAISKPKICYANESVLTGPFKETALVKAAAALNVFDCFLTQDENDIAYFQSQGARAYFVPQFADDMQYSSRAPWERRTPLAFSFGKFTALDIGAEIYKDRRKMVAELRSCSRSEFIEEHIDTSLCPDPLVSVYNKYQICVCLPTNVGGVTNRFFEAALCGCTILHYELHNQPLSDSILKPSSNCLTYKRESVEDLKKQIEFLLENPQFSANLAAQAQMDVKTNHTIAKRLEQIMTLVSGGVQRRSSLFSQGVIASKARWEW